jgi:hypothetical protein
MLEGFGSSTEAKAFNEQFSLLLAKNADDAEAIMQAATGIDWS